MRFSSRVGLQVLLSQHAYLCPCCWVLLELCKGCVSLGNPRCQASLSKARSFLPRGKGGQNLFLPPGTHNIFSPNSNSAFSNSGQFQTAFLVDCVRIGWYRLWSHSWEFLSVANVSVTGLWWVLPWVRELEQSFFTTAWPSGDVLPDTCIVTVLPNDRVLRRTSSLSPVSDQVPSCELQYLIPGTPAKSNFRLTLGVEAHRLLIRLPVKAADPASSSVSTCAHSQ